MVGYDLEDRAYCMELTYNYGLDDPQSYKPGKGLMEFGIFVPDVKAAKMAASKLGYGEVPDGTIIGPDCYRFRLLPLPADRSERFLYVMCRSGNLDQTVGFYKEVLGMVDADVPSDVKPATGAGKTAAVSYTSKTHPHQREPVLLVWYEDEQKPEITPWEGRHALGLDAEQIKALHARYQKEFPDKIMHQGDGGPISLQEKLGTLFIFIARDIDGYEMCYVSRETMLPAVVEAVTNYDGKALDWAARGKRIDKIALAGKQVEELLSKHSVVLFSKEWCPFCKKAKDAFESIEASIFIKELEDSEKKPIVEEPMAFQEYLAAKTNAGKSVPKGFIQGQFIGGGDDIVDLNKRGVLLEKCIAAGAAEKKDTQPSYMASDGPELPAWKRCARRSAFLSASWADFWLDIRALGLFRIALGAATVIEVLELLRFQDAFLDKDGVCKDHIPSMAMLDIYLASNAPESLFLLLMINFFAALGFMLGFWTRICGCLCWIFAISEHHRFDACVTYGGDQLRSHLFFWALFQPLGDVWSIDALHPSKQVQGNPYYWYEYTASTKVGEGWQNGDAVGRTLRLTQYAREPMAGLVASFPLLCRFFTYATLYVEKYVWILAFCPWQLAKCVAFLAFFGLHFGLNLTLRVGNFQLFVLSAWCVAVPRVLLDWLESFLLRWPRVARHLIITSHSSRKFTPLMCRGCMVSCMNLVGFTLMLMAFVEGCQKRGEQCAVVRMVPPTSTTSKMLLQKLDLLQRYSMFSPDAPHRTLRVQLYGVLATKSCDGVSTRYWEYCPVVELWNEGFPALALPATSLPHGRAAFFSGSMTSSAWPMWSNLSAPARDSRDFATNRWRKLVESKDHFKAIGSYVCSKWLPGRNEQEA
ncbi:unnamed protein product [Durusdinium trenchii]|uniref:VOC domain-containing protein n=1 Tax=Durusdinium trenchii TaxID=1381693 RepID=A0ABP0H9S9_9DINO